MWRWLLLILTGCSSAHSVRPLGDGSTAIEASIGGPVANYLGGAKPLPLTTLGVRHGLSDRVDAHTALHTTTLALFGLFGMEAGVGYLLLPQAGWRPALMGDVTILGFYGNLGQGDPSGGFRAFAQPDLVASWGYGKREHLAYLGAGLFVQPVPVTALSTFAVGTQLRATSMDFSLEGRWSAPGTVSDGVTLDWRGVGDRGALGLHLAARWRFGGAQ